MKSNQTKMPEQQKPPSTEIIRFDLNPDFYLKAYLRTTKGLFVQLYEITNRRNVPALLSIIYNNESCQQFLNYPPSALPNRSAKFWRTFFKKKWKCKKRQFNVSLIQTRQIAPCPAQVNSSEL